MAIDLDALEKLARAATPGPWHAWTDLNDRYNVGPSTNHSVAAIWHTPGIDLHDANALFIAGLSPAVVLELIRMARETTPVEGQSVPAGWQPVPIEPTEEMAAAAARWIDKGFDWPKAVYRAMLKATPQPQPSPSADGSQA